MTERGPLYIGEGATMQGDSVTIRDVIDYLNNINERDPLAIRALLCVRTPCNQQLADHPTAIVGTWPEGHHIGFVGLLNGIFGLSDQVGVYGKIAYAVDDSDGKILYFFDTEDGYPLDGESAEQRSQSKMTKDLRTEDDVRRMASNLAGLVDIWRP